MRVDHLALQVRERHLVVVDDAERADARRRQIEQRRRAETAGADHQHARALKRRLAGTADLAQHDMAGIALKFIGSEHVAIVLHDRLCQIRIGRRAANDLRDAGELIGMGISV